jgi:hypothetical protein
MHVFELFTRNYDELDMVILMTIDYSVCLFREDISTYSFYSL